MIKGLNGKLKRGDIVWFDNRNEYSMHVQKGRRPAVILQNNTGNFMSNTYVIAMITTKVKSTYLPIHVIIENVGLSRRSMVMLNQILTIDERDITDYVGPMPEHYLEEIERACSISLGLKTNTVESQVPVTANQVIAKTEPEKNLSVQSAKKGELIKEIKSSDLSDLLCISNRLKIKNMHLDGQDAHYIIQGDLLTVCHEALQIRVPLENLHILIDELNEIQSFN